MMHRLISSTAAVASGAVLVASLIYMRRLRQVQMVASGEKTFAVLYWNVLAAPFTFFNKEPPKCVQGHHNPDADVETLTQTRERYSRASAALLHRLPDAALLQECEMAFFETHSNPRASELLARFELHATNEAGPGTAVLLLKGGRCVPTGRVKRVGAGEATGGTSKSATCVEVQVASSSSTSSSSSLWLVSIHATPVKYAPEAVRTHLAALHDALRDDVTGAAGRISVPRVLIAGDLNAEPEEVEGLQRTSLLGGLQRVDAGLGATGLEADFSSRVTIDHAFLSPGLRLRAAEREKQPTSPYGVTIDGGAAAAPVVGASDHVWQSLSLEVV